MSIAAFYTRMQHSENPSPAIFRLLLERTQILSGIQFTTHFIEFVLVETNQSVGGNPNVIYMRKACGQRSGMAAGSKRRARARGGKGLWPRSCRAPLEVRNSRWRIFALYCVFADVLFLDLYPHSHRAAHTDTVPRLSWSTSNLNLADRWRLSFAF